MEAIAQTQAEAPTQPSMIDLIRQLETLRKEYEEARQTNTDILDRTRMAYAESFAHEAKLKTDVSNLELAIKEQAAAAFDADNSIGKSPFPGIGIQEKKITTINYSSEAALEWAKKHDMCLALDTAAFNKLCESKATRPAFVIVKDEDKIVATIAKDLTKALQGVE